MPPNFLLSLIPKLIGLRFKVQGSKVTADGTCSPYLIISVSILPPTFGFLSSCGAQVGQVSFLIKLVALRTKAGKSQLSSGVAEP
jgi:hypothetical protein